MEVDKEEDYFNPNNPYEKIVLTYDKDEDIQCDICLEYDHEDDDQIIMCDLCNAATHQTCYGGSLLKGIPQGTWFCDRCSILVQDRSKRCTEIKCFLCDEISGMMKCVD
jgi:NuA3 HAT complex component NTO1